MRKLNRIAFDSLPLDLAFKTGQENCMALVERLEQRRRVIDEALAELSHVYALLTTKLLGDAEFSRRE